MNEKITAIEYAAAARQISGELADAGWAMGPGIPRGALTGPTLYLCHIEPQSLYLIRLLAGALEQIEHWGREHALTHQDACNQLGTLLDELALAPARYADEKLRTALMVNAALYVVGTQTYALARDSQKQVNQFIVLRHYDVSVKEKILRPAACSAEALLSVEGLAQFVNQVLAIDRKQHPHRFPRAFVLKFKPREP